MTYSLEAVCQQKVVVYNEYEIINPKKNKWAGDIHRCIVKYHDLQLVDEYSRILRGKKWDYTAKEDNNHNSRVIVPTKRAVEKRMFEYLNPLNDLPNLFTDLAKIEENDSNYRGLLRFLDNYGIPGNNSLGCVNLDSDRTGYIHSYSLYHEELHLLLDDYKETFNLFMAIKKNNVGVLRSLLNYISGEWSDDDVYSAAQRSLLRKLNLNQPIRQISMKGNSFYEEVRFRNLFELAYFQITCSFLQGLDFGRCEECDHYFLRKHGRMRYCPPSRKSKRSTCANNNRIRRKRQRNKHEEEEISVSLRSS